MKSLKSTWPILPVVSPGFMLRCQMDIQTAFPRMGHSFKCSSNSFDHRIILDTLPDNSSQQNTLLAAVCLAGSYHQAPFQLEKTTVRIVAIRHLRGVQVSVLSSVCSVIS